MQIMRYLPLFISLIIIGCSSNNRTLPEPETPITDYLVKNDSTGVEDVAIKAEDDSTTIKDITIKSEINGSKPFLDGKQIDSFLLKGVRNTDYIIEKNTLIEQIITLVDSLIVDIILKEYLITAKKHTFVKDYFIEIQSISNRKEFITSILEDTSLFYLKDGKKDYYARNFWVKLKNDSSKFSSHFNTAPHNRGLNLEPGKFQKTEKRFLPLNYNYTLNLKNIVFFDTTINNRISDFIAEGHDTTNLYNYLSENYDYFNRETIEINSQSISIKYITIVSDSLIYTGIDIYGKHFLLSINPLDMSLIEYETLWIY